MQDKHSISVASEIRRKLSPKLVLQSRSLNILLVGEQTEETKSNVIIKAKGRLEVRGEASNIHMKSKIISAIRESSGGRQVIDLMTARRDDPTKSRDHGFF